MPLLIDHYSTQVLGKNKNVSHQVDVRKLELAAGQFAVILGPSGSGKSLLLKSLVNLVKPESAVREIGQRAWFYQDFSVVTSGLAVIQLGKSDEKHLGTGEFIDATDVYYLNQEPGLVLDGSRTVRDYGNLLCKHYGDRGFTEGDFEELLEQVDLKHCAGMRCSELSGGTQQRLMLLIAFAVKPALLLVDEPFSAQDGNQHKRITGLLKDMVQSGSSSILVTHELRDIEYCASLDLTHFYSLEKVEKNHYRLSEPMTATYVRECIDRARNGDIDDTKTDDDTKKDFLATMLLNARKLGFLGSHPIKKTRGNTPVKLCRLRDLDFKYGIRKVLSGVNVSVKSREALGIVGESGSGKSTLLAVINRSAPMPSCVLSRSCDSYQDCVAWDDEISTQEPRFRDFVQLLVQDCGSVLSWEVGDVGPLIESAGRNTSCNEKTVRAIALEAARRLGIKGLWKEKLTSLSGGQRRLVQIARVLTKLKAGGQHKTMLLLDEPTRGLDLDKIQLLLELLKELREDDNVAQVIVSHDDEVVKNMCDVVVEVTTLIEGAVGTNVKYR